MARQTTEQGNNGSATRRATTDLLSLPARDAMSHGAAGSFERVLHTRCTHSASKFGCDDRRESTLVLASGQAPAQLVIAVAQSLGGCQPALTHQRRASTRSTRFSRTAAIVALPVDVLPMIMSPSVL